MCGITGIIQLDKKPVDSQILKKMTKTLAHRGPDDEGMFIDENIGLGHRRLSIIDLTKAGHQPMFYDNKNLTIVYNGEIYNYLELKEELIGKGYKFTTKTDTEVILAAYKEWGVECLTKFNGMWAFIIYDRRNKLLFVARDRLGVKPIYYYRDKNKIFIASEIKAILSYPGIIVKENKKIIWDYLVTGWLDHTQETFFEGIKELRGGNYMIIKSGRLKIHQYWDLGFKKTGLGKQRNIEEFQQLFFDSVRLRLHSDVPLGTCLSGGLDSSAIVMAINKFLKKEKFAQIGKWQKTFSAVYGRKFVIDEQKFIREVIKKTGAKSYLTFPEGKKLAEEIKKLIWHQDQPFSTTSIFAQWNVFKLAGAKKIKVMLDGQGADELLAGYTGYFGINLMSLLKKGKIGTFLLELFYFAYRHPSFLSQLKMITKRAFSAGWFGASATKKFQRNNIIYKIFQPDFLALKTPPQRKRIYDDYFQDALYHSLKMNLSSLLRYEDRNSMAFSLESRVPFLDYRLVEFIFSLDNSYKIRNGQTKWIMRQALKDLLPSKILNRQDKIGFATPEEDWLRGDLKPELIKVFSSKSFADRGFVDPKKVLQLFNDFIDKKISDSQIFWRLYCLEMWYRVFIDKPR